MSPTLPAHVAKVLLEKLGTDDAFRELFSSNPAKALEEAGYDWNDDTNSDQNVALRACCRVNMLASKEVIQKAFDELLTMFTSGLGQITPALDAGLPDNPKTLK